MSNDHVELRLLGGQSVYVKWSKVINDCKCFLSEIHCKTNLGYDNLQSYSCKTLSAWVSYTGTLQNASINLFLFIYQFICLYCMFILVACICHQSPILLLNFTAAYTTDRKTITVTCNLKKKRCLQKIMTIMTRLIYSK